MLSPQCCIGFLSNPLWTAQSSKTAASIEVCGSKPQVFSRLFLKVFVGGLELFLRSRFACEQLCVLRFFIQSSPLG